MLNEKIFDQYCNQFRIETELRKKLWIKLKKGAQEHGDASFDKSYEALFLELEEEALDLLGWGYVLWLKAQELNHPRGVQKFFTILRALTKINSVATIALDYCFIAVRTLNSFVEVQKNTDENNATNTETDREIS